ncbi:MAG TPA: FAD-dependent oxidoreductase [Streptosporangiaceae bacterium]|nr:FAD-dependent oxidoreductase [Streptosporangiaceae bacterium]
MRIERVVIAGGGLAGLRTAAELRAREYAGPITMVGAEPHPPYDRPPLSKKLMLGELDSTSMAGDAAGLDLDLRLGATATGLGDGVLRTDRGEFGFGRLVVATGAAPIRLPGPGRQHVLRTIDDALAIRAALRPGTRLAIVGAGWIGAELATVAAARGCAVTVLEAAATPAAAALGEAASALMVPWYAEAGVDLRLSQPVESVQDGGLALPGGGWLDADLVVTAVGVRPCTGWLAGSAVRLAAGYRDAVLVDSQLRASVPGVYAVGDCAAFWSGRYGRRLRVEHWDNALHAPRVAAANLLGAAEEFDPVPYFWSEQFGRMVQFAGHRDPADQAIERGDPGEPRWARCWVRAEPADPGGADGIKVGQLTAVLTVGKPRDLLQGRRVIEAGRPVDTSLLADPAVAVRDAVAG